MALPTKPTPPKTDLAALTTLIYGQPKIGKSTFCAASEGALFLATEPGLNNLEVYQVAITSWETLLATLADVAKGDHPFKTLVIDTVDNAYKMCVDYICAQHNVTHPTDLEYGKGHGLINNEFQRVLNKLGALPYGLMLTSHAQTVEIKTRTGKYDKTVPTLPNKAREILLGLVDIILFADMTQVKNEKGDMVEQRVIRTKPASAYEAGDRTGRLPEVLPLDFNTFALAANGNVSKANPTKKGA